MVNINLTLLFSLLIIPLAGSAQDTAKNNALSWTAFLDIYYSYDFNRPANHQKPFFEYNHDRHNEFNANLAFVKTSYLNGKYRANLGFMAGTYPEKNLAAELILLRHIYEANAGIKISKKNNLWIDAGILPSHIGFETAISIDCWTLTRSILADNSPYYEAGVKTTFISKNEKWLMAAMILNGWQRIRRPENNNTLAFGMQATYTPSGNFLINLSGFIGNDHPDSARMMRYFQNFYSIIQITKKWGLTLGFDAGLEQKQKGSSHMNTWHSAVIIIQHQISAQWKTAARVEYYKDPNGVIIPHVAGNACNMKGVSVNIDRAIGPNMVWRIEGRSLWNNTPYFIRGSELSGSDHAVTTSIAIKF